MDRIAQLEEYVIALRLYLDAIEEELNALSALVGE